MKKQDYESLKRNLAPQVELFRYALSEYQENRNLLAAFALEWNLSQILFRLDTRFSERVGRSMNVYQNINNAAKVIAEKNPHGMFWTNHDSDSYSLCVEHYACLYDGLMSIGNAVLLEAALRLHFQSFGIFTENYDLGTVLVLGYQVEKLYEKVREKH